jgi:hypothetical protein
MSRREPPAGWGRGMTLVGAGEGKGKRGQARRRSRQEGMDSEEGYSRCCGR